MKQRRQGGKLGTRGMLARLFVFAALLSAVGCSNGMGRRYYDRPTDLGMQRQAAVNANPTVQAVVNHLNQHASAIKALEAQDLTITINEGGLNSYTARGWLFYQKPRGFRLQAEALRSTEADIGSNDNEFWFWFKRNNPPALFHCSYTDFQKAPDLKLPVHPDWVAEALGVQEIANAEAVQMRQVKGAVELISTVQMPSGQTLYKVVRVANQGPRAGTIEQQRLLEALRGADGKVNWQEIWVAAIHELQNVDGYIVPKRVTLRSPKENLTLELKMDGCQVNPPSLLGKSTGNTFVRPAGYEEVDLGRSVQGRLTHTRGQSPKR